MKKLLVVAISLIAIVSCSNKKVKPVVDYSINGYVEPKDWTVMRDSLDSISTYMVDKKIVLDKDIFVGAVDSVRFTTFLSKENFNKLPNSDTLSSKIFTSLLGAKYSCVHTATFKPTKIEVSVSDWKGTPTYWVSIDFLASNAYGTPGEMTGDFMYDLKTHELVVSSVRD